MHERESNIRVEWFPRLRAPFHEVNHPPGNLRVDQAALLQVIDFKLAALFAFAAFHDVLERGAHRFGRGCRRPERLVCRAWNAIPFVKSLGVRQPPLIAAQVPFAESRRCVARAGKQLGNGYLPLSQSLKPAADRYRVRANE